MLPDFIKKIILNLAILFCAVMGLRAIVMAAMSKGPFDVVVCVLTAAAWGVIIGILAVFAYLPAISERTADFFYYRRHFLAEAPAMLAAVNGKIVSGDYAGAEDDLNRLRKKYPDSPEIAVMTLTLYIDKLQRYEDALKTAYSYLSQPRRPKSNDNILILMRASDILLDQGRLDELRAILKTELGKKIYSRPDRLAMNERLRAVTNNLSTETYRQ